jgi:hypothetical protein
MNAENLIRIRVFFYRHVVFIVPLDFLLNEMEVKIVELPNWRIAERKVAFFVNEGVTGKGSSDESDHD